MTALCLLGQVVEPLLALGGETVGVLLGAAAR